MPLSNLGSERYEITFNYLRRQPECKDLKRNRKTLKESEFFSESIVFGDAGMFICVLITIQPMPIYVESS